VIWSDRFYLFSGGKLNESETCGLGLELDLNLRPVDLDLDLPLWDLTTSLLIVS